MKTLDKFKGCLIGGAVGDALGYAVEFDSLEDILEKHGEAGITEYQLTNGVAQISDDTQMTLFTAAGLMLADDDPMVSIWKAYKDWLVTQHGMWPPLEVEKYTDLLDIPELFACRAPGGTCLSALYEETGGTLEAPVNDSKGCGGIMRVAPIGLYFRKNLQKAAALGAQAAALTHGHPLGYLPAEAVAHLIGNLVNNDELSLEEAIEDMKTAIELKYGSTSEVGTLIELVDMAVDYASFDGDDRRAIRMLGEGWVAEETLAIALYCAVKYQDDFEKAMIAAVNHSGDSDSTGAVAGNILGAYLGINAIPEKFIENLELKDVIIKTAESLYNKTV